MTCRINCKMILNNYILSKVQTISFAIDGLRVVIVINNYYMSFDYRVKEFEPC